MQLVDEHVVRTKRFLVGHTGDLSRVMLVQVTGVIVTRCLGVCVIEVHTSAEALGQRSSIVHRCRLSSGARRAGLQKKSTKFSPSVDFRVANPIATLLVLIKVGEPYRLVRTAVLKRFDASRTNASHSVQSP